MLASTVEYAVEWAIWRRDLYSTHFVFNIMPKSSNVRSSRFVTDGMAYVL
jgi:hypothetical protein